MSTKSLYVHIPFCDHICGYCDFTRFMYAKGISDSYLIRLISQINELPKGLKTIYVGGGTPTALQPEQLEALLQSLKPKLGDDYEFTFEANPESLTEDKVNMLVKYGVNRLSLGLQATQDMLLARIGRHHNFEDVKRAIALIKKCGIINFSLDLMYGLPSQTLDMFKESIAEVIKLEPNHVSIYALILEPHSLFGKQNIKPVTIDEETDMYLSCIDLMQQAGYEHYEISNFAKEGYRSKHNQVYWRYEDFYALGPGASMKVNHQRKTWTRELRTYLREDAFDEVIDLEIKDEMFEFIMMGLRIREGITFERFYQRFNTPMSSVFKEAIQKARQEGLLEVTDLRIKATDTGFIMLDDILLHFMD